VNQKTTGTSKLLLLVVVLALVVVPLFLTVGEAQAVTADVVAMNQVIVYNRLGAFNPAGMIFALARDVFPIDTAPADQTYDNSCAVYSCVPGQVLLRDNKRPRPLTLRVNEGDELQILLTNLLSPRPITDAVNENPDISLPPGQSEQPATRKVGIHINGMEWANGAAADGSKVGPTQNSLIGPGHSSLYKYKAVKEGAYVLTSGPNLGGQGGSGALASGLFGVVNVEPANSVWYRSQVTREEMVWATTGTTAGGQPILNYDAVYPPGHPYAGTPILKLCSETELSGCTGEIFHNELNAVIDGPMSNDLPPTQVYPNRGEPFREFTVAFHDEIKVVQAFPDWYQNLKFTLGSVKDGFAINYGTGGIGSEIIANRLGKGPMKDCTDCKYEEFFLTSWAVGDPAMIVDLPATISDPNRKKKGKPDPLLATKAFYPDDPSNVWHGYLNDRTKVRNIHVGTEHHIFHLHAHQWLFASLDDKSNYLDAQALGPGSSFTYEIAYGGGGNRNKTAGDSIFHCHFYPHFAQGMWGLWRVHDTFEIGSEMAADGTVLTRGLPDGEILGGGYNADGSAIPGGTPIPGVVPIPTKAMAPMPGFFVASLDDDDDPNTPDASVPFMGYPFYIPGVAGHRPPTPPLDLVADGGIPRHVITGGTADAVQTATNFDKVLLTATGSQLPEQGTLEERAAMAFHGPQPGVFHASYTPENVLAGFEVNGRPPVMGAPYADPCRGDLYDGGVGNFVGELRTYKASVIELDVQFNKVGWHFNQQRIITLDGDVAATLAGTRAPEPFVMRANTGDCVNFDHTNRVPNVYQLDDFQVRTPTDVIGQHIHLVKFDVMSADGAANGWNYEDGTLSRDEVAERRHALTAKPKGKAPGGSWDGDDFGELAYRTTRQRWYIDPGWSGNVFTHDHYGPSTHQQAGLYATLLVEPRGSQWRDSRTGEVMGSRDDGGPTSWRADILDGVDSYREFYLEFADFQLAYGQDGTPVNPPDRKEVGLPFISESARNPRPEAISQSDPGTFVVNYRNEPLALRVRDPKRNKQAAGDAGDLAFAFSSRIDRADNRLNAPPSDWPYGEMQTETTGALRGDPFTPRLRVYQGDKVSIRVQVGAHEEGHNFSMNGIKWLQQWASPYSGFRNSQMMGISEYFRFEVPAMDYVEGNGPEFGFDDYLYTVGSSVDAKWNGAWGTMRAYEELQTGTDQLLPLPNNPDPKLVQKAETCPTGANMREFNIAVVRAADALPSGTLEYNPDLHDPTALLYVFKDDLDTEGMLKPDVPIEPLILRAAAGDCIKVQLTNMLPEELHGPDPLFRRQTADLAGFNSLPMIVEQFNANQIRPSSHVGLHPQLVGYQVGDSDGMNVGFNVKFKAGANQALTAGPGEKVSYTWYAGDSKTEIPIEFGAINLIPADPIKHSNKGLVGALIIEPEGSSWLCDDDTGAGTTDCYESSAANYPPETRASATVTYSGGNFRDFVVVMQDDINMRFNDGSPTRTVDFTDAFAGDPVTPLFTASPGQEVRFRVLKPGGHNRNHVFTLHGHLWARHPFKDGSTEIDGLNDHTFWHGEQMGHGPTNHVNVVPLGGAGGGSGTPGDYLYRDMVPVHVYNGIWGIFRVQP
jgi:hypothetical protein